MKSLILSLLVISCTIFAADDSALSSVVNHRTSQPRRRSLSDTSRSIVPSHGAGLTRLTQPLKGEHAQVQDESHHDTAPAGTTDELRITPLLNSHEHVKSINNLLNAINSEQACAQFERLLLDRLAANLQVAQDRIALLLTAQSTPLKQQRIALIKAVSRAHGAKKLGCHSASTPKS